MARRTAGHLLVEVDGTLTIELRSLHSASDYSVITDAGPPSANADREATRLVGLRGLATRGPTATVVVPEPVARNVSTTVLPTSASPIWRTTRALKGRAIRHTRPPARAGNATATSWPLGVVMVDTGPAGSGPTGVESVRAAKAVADRNTAAIATRDATLVAPRRESRLIRHILPPPPDGETQPAGNAALPPASDARARAACTAEVSVSMSYAP